jgi:hypothetical protein
MRPQIEEHRRSRIPATWTLPRIFQRLLYTTTEGFIIGPEGFKLFIAPKGIQIHVLPCKWVIEIHCDRRTARAVAAGAPLLEKRLSCFLRISLILLPSLK